LLCSPSTHCDAPIYFKSFMEPEGSFLIHNNPPLHTILSQLNHVHNFPLYFPKILSNIIFPSTPRSSEWYLPFPYKTHLYHGRHCYNIDKIQINRLPVSMNKVFNTNNLSSEFEEQKDTTQGDSLLNKRSFVSHTLRLQEHRSTTYRI
jgi:hypothetical protein